jgi:cardiolipin synthase
LRHRLTTSRPTESAHRNLVVGTTLGGEEDHPGYDALKAFPPTLIDCAQVYYGPIERRERNQAGRPGKLHAKVASVDDIALVSSANLTDDACSRNLEVGVMVANPEFLMSAKTYLECLIAEKTLGLRAGNSRCR